MDVKEEEQEKDKRARRSGHSWIRTRKLIDGRMYLYSLKVTFEPPLVHGARPVDTFNVVCMP